MRSAWVTVLLVPVAVPDAIVLSALAPAVDTINVTPVAAPPSTPAARELPPAAVRSLVVAAPSSSLLAGAASGNLAKGLLPASATGGTYLPLRVPPLAAVDSAARGDDTLVATLPPPPGCWLPVACVVLRGESPPPLPSWSPRRWWWRWRP